MASSLELLKAEDELLSTAFGLWSESATGDQTCHGTIGKFIVRHLAIREAARFDLVRGLSSLPDAARFAGFSGSDRRPIREQISRLDEMSSGVASLELDTGQDFHGALERARDLLAQDTPAVPDAISRALEREQRSLHLHSASYVQRHALQRPSGSHPYGRLGLAERLQVLFGRLRDTPNDQARNLPASLREQEQHLWVSPPARP